MSLVVPALLLPLLACGASDKEPGQDVANLHEARGVGDTCANGVFGTPNWPCADGLVCVFESGSSEPQGPDGSSSASTGICQEPGGDVGDTCADGTFGTPNLPCADGLVCVFESGSSEPQGPDGSSSASTGTCQEPGGDVGDTCADGTFGTPNLPCADGLVCDFGESTEPEGPDGSSSASTGVCVEP